MSTNTPITKLFAYIADNNISEVKKLIGFSVGVEQCDEFGFTALHCACEHGLDDIIEFLLSKGAKHDLRTDLGVNPAHIAAHNGHLRALRLLYSHGANLDSETYYQMTPLKLAILQGHEDVVTFLKTHVKQVSASRLLNVAAANSSDSPSNIALVTANFTESSQLSSEGLNPLMIAAAFDNVNIIEYLIENGSCDPNTKNADGFSAYDFANILGNSEAKSILDKVTLGKFKMLSDDVGKLFIALSTLDVPLIAQLLSVTPELINCIHRETSLSPLALVIKDNHLKLVEPMLKAGADPNIGQTFATALKTNDASVIKSLLSHGCLVTEENLSLVKEEICHLNPDIIRQVCALYTSKKKPPSNKHQKHLTKKEILSLFSAVSNNHSGNSKLSDKLSTKKSNAKDSFLATSSFIAPEVQTPITADNLFSMALSEQIPVISVSPLAPMTSGLVDKLAKEDKLNMSTTKVVAFDESSTTSFDKSKKKRVRISGQEAKVHKIAAYNYTGYTADEGSLKSSVAPISFPDFLKNSGLSKFASIFADNEVSDEACLRDFSQNDLVEIGLSKTDAKFVLAKLGYS